MKYLPEMDIFSDLPWSSHFLFFAVALPPPLSPHVPIPHFQRAIKGEPSLFFLYNTPSTHKQHQLALSCITTFLYHLKK